MLNPTQTQKTTHNLTTKELDLHANLFFQTQTDEYEIGILVASQNPRSFGGISFIV